MTGAVAEELERPWAAFELNPDYLEGSVGRFQSGTVELSNLAAVLGHT